MTLTPHNDPQPETAQSASSSPNGSPAAPAPEPVSSTTPTLSSTDAPLILPQERPDILYRLFHPPTPLPLTAKGIIVYALWNRPPIIPASLASLPSEMKPDGDSFGSWYMTRCLWQPGKPDIDESRAINALTTMVNYVDALADAQANDQGNNSGTQLVYQLLQIQEITVNVPRFYRLRTSNLHYHMSREEMQEAIDIRRRGFVTILQKQFHLRQEDTYQEDTFSDLAPRTFGHYNQNTHSRGWIVLNPVRALLIGVDTSSVRIFVGLLQRRDMDLTKQRRGIAPDRYDDVLGRVSLWNAAQDIKETVDQVADLASSGQKATDGVVLLSLALAIIGILVAVNSQLHFSALQLWGTYGLLSLASILFWRYAHSSKSFWLLLGLLSIVCALLLDIIHI